MKRIFCMSFQFNSPGLGLRYPSYCFKMNNPTALNDNQTSFFVIAGSQNCFGHGRLTESTPSFLGSWPF